MSWPAADPAGAPIRCHPAPEAVAARPASVPKPQPDLPTSIGRYRVVAWLGGGGQGDAYRVIHPNLGEEKATTNRQHVGPGEQATLIDEGKVLAGLEHPNLVKVYDLDFHDNRPFLVMAYIHGRSLDDYARDEPMTPQKAATLVAKLAGTLGAAHRRDHSSRYQAGERPGQRTGRALADRLRPGPGAAGVVRTRQLDLGRHARLHGPQASPAGARSDRPAQRHLRPGRRVVFPAHEPGALFGETTEEIWDRARCDFERGALKLAKAPRRLERICLKAMAAEPAGRYGTAEEMGRDLNRWLHRPRRLGVAAACLAVAAIVSGFLLRPSVPTEKPNERGPGAIARPNPSPPTPPLSSTRTAPLHGNITLWVDEPGNAGRRGVRLNKPGAADQARR